MRKLTKIVAATLISAAMLGTAGIASAHPGYNHGSRIYERSAYEAHGRNDRGYERETPYRAGVIHRQLEELAYRVNRSDWRDRVSEREADGLRRDIRSASQQFRWLNRDGLDHREIRTLQARIDQIRYRLHLERNDWDGRRG